MMLRMPPGGDDGSDDDGTTIAPSQSGASAGHGEGQPGALELQGGR